MPMPNQNDPPAGGNGMRPPVRRHVLHVEVEEGQPARIALPQDDIVAGGLIQLASIALTTRLTNTAQHSRIVRPLVLLLCLALAAPAGLEAQCSGLGCAIESHDRALTSLSGRLLALEAAVDSLDPVSAARMDSALVAFRANFAAVLEAGVEAGRDGSQPNLTPVWIAVGGAAILAAASLVFALAHHHHATAVGGTQLYVRPAGFCWPPGHCKGGR